MGSVSCLAWQNCSTNLPSGSDQLVGWVPESPGRSSMTLLWDCILTTFLCTWVTVHPRINQRRKFRFIHKIALFLKALVAPEFIAVEGAQEWAQAKKVFQQCAEQTGDDFHMVQAFYVGMLGIRYRTPQGTKVVWPNQFVWLLEQGLFKWEKHADWNLTRESIKDRSNADATAKFFALVQVGWFVTQAIVRAAHNLPLAPFESMTLGYIPLFALTYVFWWVKPKDISTPSVIDLPVMSEAQLEIFESMAISDDFDDEGTARQNSLWAIWYLTPRIFEKEERDREMKHHMYETEQAPSQHHFDLKVHDDRPLQRAKPLQMKLNEEVVLSHWDPQLYRSRLWPVTCLFGISFPGLHLISWDGTFPTIVELWLWRGAAITSMVTMLVFMQFEKVVVRWRDPLTFYKVLPPALYLVSRVVTLGEAFAALRASNPAVYETWVVSNYWLHLT